MAYLAVLLLLLFLLIPANDVVALVFTTNDVVALASVNVDAHIVLDVVVATYVGKVNALDVVVAFYVAPTEVVDAVFLVVAVADTFVYAVVVTLCLLVMLPFTSASV